MWPIILSIVGINSCAANYIHIHVPKNMTKSSLRKEAADSLQHHHWFLCRMMSENKHRNSILMMHHYPDQASASD